MILRALTGKMERLIGISSNALGGGRAKGVLKGVVSAAGTKVLVSGVTLLSLPLAVRYLGPERYGVWVTVVTLTSWVALLDLGVSNALTNSISIAFAKDDRTLAARHVSNALALSLSLAGLLGLLCAFLFSGTNWVHLFNVSTHVPAAEVRQTVAIAFALVLLSPTCTVGSKILSGHQETHVYSWVTAAGAVGSLVGLALGIRLHLSMPALFFCTSGITTGSGLLALIWIVTIYKPWLRPRPSHISSRILKDLLGSGSSLFMVQIASIVVFGTDNIVVSHYLGAAEVTPYSVSMRLVAYAQLLPTFIFPSLWPAYAEADTRGDYLWIRKTFIFALVASALTMAVSLFLFVLFGRLFIAWWVGTAAVPRENLLVAMAFWTFISAITGVQSCLLSAVGRTRIQGLSSIIAAAVNLPLSILLVQRIGSLGAVLGTIISYVLLVIFPQILEVRNYFRDVFRFNIGSDGH